MVNKTAGSNSKKPCGFVRSRRDFLRTCVTGYVAYMLSSESSAQNQHNVIQAIKNYISKNKVNELHITLPSGSESNVRAIADIFESYGNVKIVLNAAPVDAINDYLMLAAQSETYAGDLALPATFAIPDLIKAEAIIDLSTLRKKYESFNVEEGMLYQKGDFHDDKFYGYQTDGDTYLTYFNNRFFKGDLADSYQQTHGKAIQAPKTWAELDQQIQHFYLPQKNIYGGLLFRNSSYVVWEWWLRFHAKGGVPLLADSTPAIDSQIGIQALKDMLAITPYMPKSVFKNGLFENWQEYAKGQIYCNIGWGGTQKYLRNHAEHLSDGVIATVPPGDIVKGEQNSIGYFNWGWNYTVPKSSRHPELAFLFSLLAVGPDTSNLAVQKDGFFDPFREEHYSDKIIENMYGRQFLNTHKKAMRVSIPDFYLDRQGEYFDILRRAILDALHHRREPHQALSSAAREWQTIHKQVGKKLVTERWRSLYKSYPKEFISAQ